MDSHAQNSVWEITEMPKYLLNEWKSELPMIERWGYKNEVITHITIQTIG